jgi:hypothetical protein
MEQTSSQKMDYQQSLSRRALQSVSETTPATKTSAKFNFFISAFRGHVLSRSSLPTAARRTASVGWEPPDVEVAAIFVTRALSARTTNAVADPTIPFARVGRSVPTTSASFLGIDVTWRYA